MLNNFSLLLIFPSGKETAVVAGKSLRTFNMMRQLNLCRFSSCIALADVCVRNHIRVPVCTCPWVTLVLHDHCKEVIVGPLTFK